MPLPQSLNDWMDDLSEDWISQPRQSSSTPSSPSQLRASTTNRKSILSERSQNTTNIQANSVQRHTQQKRRSLSHRSISDVSSTGSQVGRFDTTARKSVSVSPPKSRRTDEELEWRRRLLQGQLGQQQDLFSPMALEGVFAKPGSRGTFRSTEKEKPKGLSFLKSFANAQNQQEIPSSPPPWPQMTASLPKAVPASTFGTVNTKLSQLDEEEEESSRMGPMQEQESNDGSVLHELPSKIPIAQQKPARNFSNSSILHHTNTAPASRKVSFGSVRLEPTSRKASDGTSWNLTQNSDDFSPVFISKHNTVDGGIAYAALDLSKSELEARLQNLRSSQNGHARSRSASHSTRYTNGTGDESSLARLESEALPEDLPVGTPDVADVASINDFVEIKRGGYSQVGSFKRRPLSPSPLKRPVSAGVSMDESSMLPRHIDLDYSGIPPAVPTPPNASAPKTPNTARAGDFLSPQREKSSGSPLKLFENHDTFTANRLQRRISQLEEPEADTLGEVRGSPSRRATGDLSAVDEASFDDRAQREGRRQSSIQHHFGAGDYDSYAFEEPDLSQLSDANDQLSRSVSPDGPPPGYQVPFKFHVEEPPSDFIDTFKGRRKPSKDSANGQLSIAKRSDRNRPALSVFTQERVTSQPSQLSQVSEGKRPLTPSPFKSPTPKRRRTVVHHEFAEFAEDPGLDGRATADSHASLQHAFASNRTTSGVGGRKRKDARKGDERSVAEAEILAQREILRPRNPTPSQRRREEAERAIREAQARAAGLDMDASSSPLAHAQPLEAIKEQLSLPPLPGESKESVQVRQLATHLAVIGEDVAQRKKSVTTQDFLDDAMKVMHFIRTQYRPNSNLTSLNEGASGGGDVDSGVLTTPEDEEEDGFEVQGEMLGLGGMSWERPPSREGRPRSAWRDGRNGVVDPRVVSHLRKFQENEEDPFLTASSRGTHPDVHMRNEATQEHIETIESDPPGIQIMGQSKTAQAQGSRSPSDKAINSAGSRATGASHSSRTSIDSTMGRTTNSRKSENVATLAPDAVAHLIPEQVASMTYDKELGRWVKSKSPKKTRASSDRDRLGVVHSTAIEGHSGMTGSDNDPFGDIPDLTVDSMEETKHLLLSRSAGRKPIGVPPEGRSALFDEFGSRPASRDQEVHAKGGQQSSKVDYAYLSPTKPHERSPSPRVDLNQPEQRIYGPPKPENEDPAEDDEVEQTTEEDVEHEISILDGRGQQSPPRQARKVTVSLSSPAWTRNNRSGLSPVLESPAVSVRDYGRRPPQPTPSFKSKPATRELSLSVRVSGTVTSKQTQDLTQIPSSSPYKGDVTFCLSELPDFTLNQIDEREPVLTNRALSHRNTVGPIFRGDEDRFAQGNHLLVKALQDGEPAEPYWEDLRKLDLREKGLTSLHLLDVMCDRLEKVDISRNAIAHLDGAPHTIRLMNASHNLLTSLTAWGHLFNLQYLDISHNQIDSLEGLAGMVHLRELRADGNQVKSLEGIEDLDGLLRLSLRGNQLTEVSFEDCNLQRLESLDLGGNGLVSVQGLHCLPALKELKLDGNKLTSFPHEDQQCLELRRLDLSNNILASVSLTTFAPKLEILNLDKNTFATTSGIDQLQHLSVLTLRSQRAIVDLAPILEARQSSLHFLALSENHISSLTLPADWYSLRTLELASCGLNELPADFGLSVPNLRSLNLNFNAIKDLRPLLNVKALKDLHVAANRLARLRKTTAVLAKMRGLEVLDLRGNPFTLGFHLPAEEKRIVPTAVAMADDGKEANRRPDEANLHLLLPPGDKEADAQYYARLDEGTKLRRRVYEMLLANECRQLSELDGLSFSRDNVLVRDEIWDRLVLLGVVKKSNKGIGVVEDPDDEVLSSS